jgi:hypothetical protein
MLSRVLILSLVCTSLLTGCASNPPLTRVQADQMRPGEARASIISKLGKSEPRTVHVFEVLSTKYVAQHYFLQTGTRQTTMVVCSPTRFHIPTTEAVLTPFVIIFKDLDKTLFASGTIEELSKSEKPEIADLMPNLKKSYEAELGKKK